jgi:hypothetical protein
VEGCAEENVRAVRGLLLLVEHSDSAGSRQTAFLARATRGLRRPSLDARSKRQSAYSLWKVEVVGHCLIGVEEGLARHPLVARISTRVERKIEKGKV